VAKRWLTKEKSLVENSILISVSASTFSACQLLQNYANMVRRAPKGRAGKKCRKFVRIKCVAHRGFPELPCPSGVLPLVLLEPPGSLIELKHKNFCTAISLSAPLGRAINSAGGEYEQLGRTAPYM